MLTGVSIRLDRERMLRFDGMALVILERTSGDSIVEILRKFSRSDVAYSTVLAMLYAGLRHELPGSSEEAILQIVDQYVTGETIFEKVLSFAPQCAQALAEALPKEKGKNVPTPAAPEAAGTGKRMRKSATG